MQVTGCLGIRPASSDRLRWNERCQQEKMQPHLRLFWSILFPPLRPKIHHILDKVIRQIYVVLRSKENITSFLNRDEWAQRPNKSSSFGSAMLQDVLHQLVKVQGNGGNTGNEDSTCWCIWFGQGAELIWTTPSGTWLRVIDFKCPKALQSWCYDIRKNELRWTAQIATAAPTQIQVETKKWICCSKAIPSKCPQWCRKCHWSCPKCIGKCSKMAMRHQMDGFSAMIFTCFYHLTRKHRDRNSSSLIQESGANFNSAPRSPEHITSASFTVEIKGKTSFRSAALEWFDCKEVSKAWGVSKIHGPDLFVPELSVVMGLT